MNLYSMIPSALLDGNILDVGCGPMNSKLLSKNAEKFFVAFTEKRYLGVDLNPSNHSYLKQIDIFDFEIKPQYDTVICIEVVEHIPFSKWSELFGRLAGLLVDGGTLVLSVPYMEPCDSGMTNLNDVCPHVVFDINANLLSSIMPNADIVYFGRRMIQWNSPKKMLNLLIQILRRNRNMNPFKPIWMVAIWKKGVRKREFCYA